MKRIKPQTPQRATFRVVVAFFQKDRISLVLKSPDPATMALPDLEIFVGGRIVIEEVDKIGVAP